MRWHTSHKANYRDSTGTWVKYTNSNNKRKNKGKGNKKSHVKIIEKVTS